MHQSISYYCIRNSLFSQVLSERPRLAFSKKYGCIEAFCFNASVALPFHKFLAKNLGLYSQKTSFVQTSRSIRAQDQESFLCEKWRISPRPIPPAIFPSVTGRRFPRRKPPIVSFSIAIPASAAASAIPGMESASMPAGI